MNVEELVKVTGAIWHLEHEDNLYCICPLMFHCSLLINPHPTGGYEERYCFSNPELAQKAVYEFLVTGKLRYWKKHHTKNISIVENYAYPPGVKHIPENSSHTVDWNATELEKEYPYPTLIAF